MGDNFEIAFNFAAMSINSLHGWLMVRTHSQIN